MRTFVLLRVAAALSVLAVAGCSGGEHAPGDPGLADAVTSSTSAPDATSGANGTRCATAGPATTVVYRRIAGIDANLTSLDVHAPAGACNAPVVVWVHGGGYRIGDKANQISDKIRLFNDQGWILVSINYRLTRPGQPGSAQFPDHFDDTAAAIAWVRAEIGKYGGDASRLALLGHSAGADIVANVATNPRYLAVYGVGLDALRCAGPLDTEGFDKQRAGANDPDGEQEQWKVSLGNNTAYLSETSATGLIRAGIGIPPMIGVVRGTALRREIETTFLATLRATGIAATTIDAVSLTHEQVSSRMGAAGDTVMTPPLMAFLRTCLR